MKEKSKMAQLMEYAGNYRYLTYSSYVLVGNQRPGGADAVLVYLEDLAGGHFRCTKLQ